MLDSGFCVSKRITALLEFGVYAAALVKKHKYWTKGVPGDAIDQYFADKDVTYLDMLEAITERVLKARHSIFFLQGNRVYR